MLYCCKLCPYNYEIVGHPWEDEDEKVTENFGKSENELVIAITNRIDIGLFPPANILFTASFQNDCTRIARFFTRASSMAYAYGYESCSVMSSPHQNAQCVIRLDPPACFFRFKETSFSTHKPERATLAS